MTTLGRPTELMSGPAGRVAEHVDHSALRAVHKRLAHIAVDDHFSPLDDLAKLVLGVAMHRDFQPVHARTQIIPAAAIDINDHVFGFRAEPAADVALADAVETDEAAPAFHERVHQQLRIAVVAFRRKTRGVNDQCGFVLLWLPQMVARFEINETIRALGGIFGADPGEAAQQPVQLGMNDVEQMAASFRAGGVAPVLSQCQSLNGGGRPGGSFAASATCRQAERNSSNVHCGSLSRSHSNTSMPLPGQFLVRETPDFRWVR